MKSSKQSSSAPAKGQREQQGKPENDSGRFRLNSLADVARLRLENAANAAAKLGVASIETGADGTLIVQFTPLKGE